MMKLIPLNVTNEGCAFTIRTGYERHAYLNGMTRGGDSIRQPGYWKSMIELMQIGNLLPPREGFDNPQEGRVYLPTIAPTIRNDNRYWFLLENKASHENRLCYSQGLGSV